MKYCLVCKEKLIRSIYKYCSNKCASRYIYLEYIKNWKLGMVNGNRGINTKNISGHIKRYLIEKFGEKCIICGWNKINPYTGRVPIEIDHINGISEDNNENNLRLVCPNCHSLSENYRNLNRGKGRDWRRFKYLKQ